MAEGGKDEQRRATGAGVRRGARSGLLTQAVVQIGSTAATIVLARILTPSEFGVVALSVSIASATSLLSMVGIRSNIITRRERAYEAASTFFWLVAVVGLMLAVALVLVAGPLTAMLGQPEARSSLQLLAVSVPASLLAVVPQGVLLRRMKFGAYNASVGASAILYFVAEVVLALRGWGATAVIVGLIIQAWCLLGLGLALARWWPSRRPDWGLAREDARISGQMWANGAANFVGDNGDYWVTSRFLGAPGLGVYYVAYVLPNIIRTRLSMVSQEVLLRALSEVAEEPDKLASRWRRAWRAQMGVGVPAMFGLAALAPVVILVFFGGQWGAAVAPLRVLAVVALLEIHMRSVALVAISQRRIVLNVITSSVRAVLTVLLSILGVITLGGVTGVAVGVLAACVLALVVQEIVTARRFGIGLLTVPRETAAFLLSAAAMSGLVLLIVDLTNRSIPLIQLIVGTVSGAAAYAAVGGLLFRSEFRDLTREGLRLVKGR